MSAATAPRSAKAKAQASLGRPAIARRLSPLALFLAFLGFYLLTASGHLYAVDEETLFRITEGIVERHSVALPDDAWGMVGNRSTPDGPLYAQYTPGQPVVAVPLYLAGRLLATRFPPESGIYILRFCVSLLGAFVTAATVALLYRLARHLGYGDGAALTLAATYGLATTAWPHGRTFFAEPLTALALLAAFYALRVGTETKRDGWLIAAGLATAAACLVKPHAAIAVPVLALYLLARVVRRDVGENRGTREQGSRRRGERARIGLSALRLTPYALRQIVAYGLGGLVGALPFAVYNARVYGNPFSTGYVAVGDLFTTPFLTGLYGLTLSSGKGIVWYSPPIVLAVVGWWAFWRRHGAEALACLGIGLVHLAFYSRVAFWHGDGSWGPRYLTIALPFLMLPALGLLGATGWRRLRLVAVTVLVTLGIGVQLLGVLVNFDWYLQRSDEQARHFTPSASPLLAHARILKSRVGEWYARALPPPDVVFLRAGFSYAEPEEPGGLFPRWTVGAGTIAIHPANHDPLLVKLTFFDHRPANLRDADSVVLINGVPLAPWEIERTNFTSDGQGWTYQFAIPATATGDPILVALQSTPWNPKTSGVGDRDEDLGVFVHNVEVWRAGVPLAVREALVLGPLPETPHQLFWWFNDDAIRHHPLDWWATYALAAELPRDVTLGWLLAYGSFGLVIFLGGLALCLRALPPGTLRVPTRRRRTRKRPASRRRTPAGTTPDASREG
jgi:Dolichyl-phosphate-mannose-protein mannosyltransferase